MCIQWTCVLYSAVITRQSKPPISQFNRLCYEYMKVGQCLYTINFNKTYRNVSYLTRIDAARVMGRCVFGRLGRVTIAFLSLCFAVFGFCIVWSLTRPLFPTKHRSTAVLHLYIFILHFSVSHSFNFQY